MLWGISEMVNARASKSLPLLTSRNFWSSRNESKPLSKLKHVFRKCCGLSQKWWRLELPNLCHCVQPPLKLTSRNFWSSRNEIKPLSKQKCVLRKCCRVSQKWWMLKLPSLCHCVQHPWKLTSRNFWGSRSEIKPLSKLKHVFWENAVVLSQKRWILELPNHSHCVHHPFKTY